MVPEFKNMSEALQYVKQTMILDVSELACGLNRPEVIEAIYPPKPGIYLKADGVCIHQFRDDSPIYDLSQFVEANKNNPIPSMYALRAMTPLQRKYFENMPMNHPPPLTTLAQVLHVQDGVCNSRGELMSRLSRLRRIAHHLTETPSNQKKLSDLARVLVCRILKQECPHARVGLLDDTSCIIKGQYLPMFYEGEFDNLLHHARMSIRRMVGEDVFSIYTVQDAQHHLRISKGMDYRIFEYYQIKFGQDDE